MTNHHKKLDNKVPAWLWFALYNGLAPQQKWNEEKEALSLKIKDSLKQHLVLHSIKNDIITEPNNNDYHGIYSQNNDETL